MKYINIIASYIIISIAFICKLSAQDGFTISAKISNPNNYKVLIAYHNGDKYVMDTSYVMEKGCMVFKGKTTGISMATFVVRNPNNVIMDGGGFIPGPNLVIKKEEPCLNVSVTSGLKNL